MALIPYLSIDDMPAKLSDADDRYNSPESHLRRTRLPVPLSPLLEQNIRHSCNTQALLRAALLRSDFEYLEHFFADIDTRSKNNGGDNHEEVQAFVHFHVLFDAYSFPETKKQLALLHAWTAAYPHSYYAHYFLGEIWELVAADIRTTGLAMDVESDRWEAAALARDNAAITLLHALTLDAQPVRALYLMMRLFAYLGEPAWMDYLFRHQAGEVTDNSDDISPAGHQRFATYGGSLLTPPTQLPALLQTRDPDEAGYSYWLAQILRFCPNCLDALTTATYYLTPRWYGSHRHMKAFINGPQCAALTEAQRGDLWWVKEFDYLGDLPDHADDDDDNKPGTDKSLHRQAYQQLLARPLLDYTRIDTLFAYAKFCSYYGELDEAYAMAAEACKLQAQCGWHKPVKLSNFEYLAQDLIVEGIPDPDGVLAHVLQVAEYFEESSWFLLLACAARHEGKWGMPQKPFPGQFERLLTLIAAIESKHDSVTEVLELLWNGGHEQASWWLAHELAHRGVALAQCFLANVYRGEYEDGPEIQMDEKMAEQWQRSAAAAAIPHSKAVYLLARNYLVPPVFTRQKKPEYLYTKQLLEKAMAADIDGAKLLLMQIIINSGSTEEAAWVHAELIPSLLESDDNTEQLITGVFLSYMYGTGHGVAFSPFLAHAWANYAQSIDEEEVHKYYLDTTLLLYRKLLINNGIRGWFNRLRKDTPWRELVRTAEAYLPPDFDEDADD
ncbi:MAG: DUF4034 domain-containing protein [Undibacterium umbellatum]|uniref:DUF4034 domain-containing protein n=1 Tax=Undibacterium umbellatum TaxID=2762300 RepID=UPI003BB7611E